MQRDARFADAARADERDEARASDQLDDFVDLAVAPDKRRQLDGQIVRQRSEGAQRREFVRESGRDELVDALGVGEVFEAVFAEVAQGRARREAALCEVGRDAGDDDLAAVRHGEESRDAVDDGPEVVPVALVGGAGVQGDAHAHAVNGAEVFCG